MALPSDYISGTITLTAGSVAFSGVGTGWLAADFQNGDTILDIAGGGNRIAVIASITGEGAGTLTKPWEGPNLVGVAYRMRYEWDSSRVSAQSRAMIEQLGSGTLQSLAAAPGVAGDVVVFDGPNSISVEPRTNFINGVAYDVQVNTLADRAAYNGQSSGFTVLVSDVGDGRSAVYSKASNASGDWTNAAYITGPTSTVPGVVWRGTYDAGTLYAINDGVTFNGSSFRKLTTAAAGTAPSSATPPVDTAAWEVLAAKGATGSISGVTTFWQDRITVDADAPAARTGLGLGVANSPTFQSATLSGAGAIGLTVERTAPSMVNSVIETKTAAGSVYFGHGAQNTFAIGPDVDISGATSWLDVNATVLQYKKQAIYHAGNMPKATQAQAEAGTSTSILAWAPEQVRQAIIALAPADGNGRTALSGTANAIILTSSVPLITGLSVRFRASSANTGATTIAYGGGAAVACRTITGVALPSGYIRTGVDTIAIYDGTFWVLDRQIERGSNANGEYTRSADGTQICWMSGTTLTSMTTVPMPAAFIDATYSLAGLAYGSTTANNLLGMKAAAATTTQVDIGMNQQSGGTFVAIAFRLTVFGRWF